MANSVVIAFNARIKRYLGDEPLQTLAVFFSLFVISGALLPEFFEFQYAHWLEISVAVALVGLFLFEKALGKTLVHVGWPPLAITVKRLFLFMALFVLARELAPLYGFGRFGSDVVGMVGAAVLLGTYFSLGWNRPWVRGVRTAIGGVATFTFLYTFTLVVALTAAVLAFSPLPRFLGSASREEVLQLLTSWAWPGAALLALFALRKSITYLFLEAKELNIFGIKGRFKSSKDVIHDLAGKMHLEWIGQQETGRAFAERIKKMEKDNENKDAFIAQLKIVVEQQFNKIRELEKKVSDLANAAQKAKEAVAVYERIFGASGGARRVAEGTAVDSPSDDEQDDEEGDQ